MRGSSIADVVAILREVGGTATSSELLRACTRSAVSRAVAAGAVVMIRRGRYSLPGGELDELWAERVTGVISHESAAYWYGWSLKREPERPMITVPRNRKVRADLAGEVDVRRHDLPPHAYTGLVTTPIRTVIDCARTLPFDEALAIADSALRDPSVTREKLLAAAHASPRTGRRAAVRVAGAADGRAANAFESVVRAISLDVPGLDLVPQVRIAPSITPDLVDTRLRIVVECDSWTYHAEKSAFARDLERYKEVIVAGWLLVRFSRQHAMERQAYVRDVLTRAVQATRG